MIFFVENQNTFLFLILGNLRLSVGILSSRESSYSSGNLLNLGSSVLGTPLDEDHEILWCFIRKDNWPCKGSKNALVLPSRKCQR